MTATTVRVSVPLLLSAYALVLATVIAGQVGDAPAGGEPGADIRALDLIVVVKLVVAGAIVAIGGGSRRLALIASTTGVAALGPYFAVDPGTPNLLRLTAVGLTVVLPVLVLHLVIAATGAGRPARGRKVAFVLSVLGAFLIVVRVVTYDPFYEPACACSHIPAMIEPSAGVRAALLDGVRWLALAAGGLLTWSTGRGLLTETGRRRHPWVLGGGLVAGSAITVSAIMGLVSSPSFGAGPRLQAIATASEALLLIAVLAISIGLVVETFGRLGTRSRLRRLADDIQAAPPPGSLEDALAAALGDADVTVGYWLEETARHVDADGAPFAPGDHADDRRMTTIERGGVPVAIVRHRADLDPAILRDIGSSLRIALDNERLRAASLAHLRDLQTSRARIVEVGDAERRRIERDLHDGAQQGLLAVAFDLRLARLNAERGGNLARAERLANAESIAMVAVEELRRIARGVHPAVLSQAGLAAALESLRDGAPIPVEVRSETRDPVPAPVEAAAYRVAVDALADAVRRGARELAFRVDGDAQRLVIDAIDDGAITDSPAVRISDRVGASGGSVVMHRRPDGYGNILSAVLPCA